MKILSSKEQIEQLSKDLAEERFIKETLSNKLDLIQDLLINAGCTLKHDLGIHPELVNTKALALEDKITKIKLELQFSLYPETILKNIKAIIEE